MEQNVFREMLTNHEYLDIILERMEDGIYITDNEANTIYLNHRYESISGLNAMDLLGKNMGDLVEQGIVSASGTLSVLETGKSIAIQQSFQTGRRANIIS